jgi:hypothetical protein
MLKRLLLTVTAAVIAATVLAASAGGADQSRGNTVTIQPPQSLQ